MQKWRPILFSAILLLYSLTACTIPNNNESTGNSVDTSTSTVVSVEESEPDYAGYINMDSQFPVVNDPITLKVGLMKSSMDNKNAQERWFWKWAALKTNINFEFELIDESARSEKINLMFASDNLPDVMMMMNLSNAEIAKYGAKEGMLMPLNDMIDKYAPDILSLFNEEPSVKASVSYIDGCIYSLPTFSGWEEHQVYYTMRGWINNEWLKALNLAVPETLNDFYEVMVAFRDDDPNGNGSQDEVPICYRANNISRYIYNAMGVVISDSQASNPSAKPQIKDGEVIVPANSGQLYKDFLTLMNKFYSEDLLDPDMYTLTTPQIQAKAAEDRVGIHFSSAPHTLLASTYESWSSLAPLTSEWNSTKIWPKSENLTGGAFAISSHCAYPEAAVRFINYMFTTEGAIYAYYGPPKGSPDLLDGFDGWWIEGNQDITFNLGNYENNLTYLINEIALYSSNFPGLAATSWAVQQTTGFKAADTPGPAYHWRTEMKNKGCLESYTEGFPIVFYDVQTNDRLNELETPIRDYITSMEAKIIVGTEPLDNFDSYVAHLKTLGIDELEQIYKDAYADYKAALS